MNLPNEIKVDVLQDDIKKGKPRCPCVCPIALAVKRAVEVDTIAIWGRGLNYINGIKYRLCDTGSDFVYNFDKYEEVKPCSVVLTKFEDIDD